MLVLRRKAGESFLIGEDIEVSILEVNSQGAKIGIRAPRSSTILRKELKIIEEQNRLAAFSPALGKVAEVMKDLELNPRSPTPIH